MDNPDVDLSTRVRAKQLRFKTVPRTKLTFEGEPGHESSSKVERENLPEEVEPGVTYRGVEVRWSVRQRIIHPADPERSAPGGESL
jgi:hypothetical protein